MFSALCQGARMAPSCLLTGQGCLTESFLWQIESPNSVLVRLRRLIFCPCTHSTALHRMRAQEPSKVLSWLKLYEKAATKYPQEMPGKAQGLSNINPTLVTITFPSDDPSSSSRSVGGCPTTSRFKYGLRSDYGPRFKTVPWFCDFGKQVVCFLWASVSPCMRNSCFILYQCFLKLLLRF